MHNKVITALLAAALALPVVALADAPATTTAGQPLTQSNTVEARATVTAVDQSTRIVSLKGENGTAFDVEAGPDVRHLDQVKVGDTVLVTYTESLAFQVVPEGEKSQGVTQTANRVQGGAEVGQQVTTSFTVASVDPKTNILWVTLPNGNTKQIHVQDPAAQARLPNLRPGNVVSVTYTESVAIRLEKLARQ